jgi:predicted nucleic acid-binding protein
VAWKRIVNASPLIFLTRLGLLDILNEFGAAVQIPDAVLAELSFLDRDDPAAVAARSTHWIQVVPTPPIPDFIRSWRLGAGETSVLSVALAEVEADTADENEIDVVLDDAKARRCAHSLGLGLQGTLAFLLIAKKTGRIHAVRPLLERLHAGGMHVSGDVMLRVLTQAGE